MARADQVRNVDDYLAPRPSRVGNAPRFLKDEIREMAFRLARANHSAEFIAAALVGLVAGWSAFSGYGYFAARAAAGRPLAPAGQADSSRPIPSASPLCSSRSRRSSRRRLAREAGAKEQDASAKKIRDAETAAQAAQLIRDAEAAAQAAQQIRDAEAAAQAAQQIRDAEAAEQAAQQMRDAEAAAKAAQLNRDAEAAAAQQIRDADATKQGAKQSAVAAQDAQRKAPDAVAQAAHRREDTETAAHQAAQRRQDAVDRLRRDVTAVSRGTARRWQWARIGGRLSRTDAQRRQDATDSLQQNVYAFVSPTSGTLRLEWGRFDGRSPGRQLSVRLDSFRSLASMRDRTPVDAEL